MTQISFTGDIAFTKHFSRSCQDGELLSDRIIDFLTESDYNIVNVEGAIFDGEITAEKKLTHANPPQCIERIKSMGGNVWNIANNHAMDCGEAGLISTLALAKENGCKTLGAGMNKNEAQAPLTIDAEGGIGIVSVTYFRQNRATDDTPGCFIAEDEADVKKRIEEVKAKNRWCIVVSHVGQEFSQLPMPHVRERYKRYLKYGADIVVGHHSHVVQNYEVFGDKIVFYSLGNFIFDTDYQRVQKYTEYGMLLKLRFEGDKYSWEYLPVKNDREKQRLSECEAPAIFRHVSGFEYGLLWPLAAKHLCLNERKKNIYHNPSHANRTGLEWFMKHEYKNRKSDKGRDILVGRFLNIPQLWIFADRRITRYIREK